MKSPHKNNNQALGAVASGPSLSLLLPLGVVVVLLLVFVTMFLVVTARGEAAIVDLAKRDLRAQVVRIAQDAESDLPGQSVLLRRRVQDALSDPRVTAVAVLDEQNLVLLAHRPDWLHRLAQDVLPPAPVSLIDRARSSRVPQLQSSDDGMTMTALVSYVEGSDAKLLRSQRRGLVYLVMDLSEERATLREGVWRSRGVDIGVALLLAVGLAWGLRRWVAKPLRNLERAIRRVAGGELAVRLPETGPAEIARLGQGFNQMARGLESAQADLRASEERLSTILYSTGDAMLALDTELRVTLLNPVAEALTGWREAEAKGRPVREVFCIENAHTGGPAMFPLERVLAEGVVIGLANHTRLIARDGRRTHIADSAAPIRLADQSLGGVVIVFRDVSEQYALQEALARSEWHFRTLANSGIAMVWTSDVRGRNEWSSQQWLDFIGKRAEDSTPDDWPLHAHPDDWPDAITTWREASRRHEPCRIEVRYRRHDGVYRWILQDAVPRFDLQGRFAGYIGHGLDVTEQREAREQMQTQLSELQRWHAAMLGREGRMAELKAEVNELLVSRGLPPRYPSVHQEGPLA